MNPHSIRRAKPLLGTIVEISASAESKILLIEAIEAAFNTIKKVHNLMSFYDQDSDVSRLNRRAMFEPQTVHTWVYEVIAFSKQLGSESSGYFNISASKPCKSSCAVDFLLPYFGAVPLPIHEDILLLGKNTIAFKRPLAIDLGGIAKGFAVDCAIDVLTTYGIESAVVNAGGDIGVLGNKLVPIYVRYPKNPTQAFKALELSNGGVATSANYFSGKKGVRHIVNPMNMQEWNLDVSVTVVAPKCLIADALTKIVALAEDNCSKLLRRYNAEALIVTPSSNSTDLPSQHMLPASNPSHLGETPVIHFYEPH